MTRAMSPLSVALRRCVAAGGFVFVGASGVFAQQPTQGGTEIGGMVAAFAGQIAQLSGGGKPGRGLPFHLQAPQSLIALRAPVHR